MLDYMTKLKGQLNLQDPLDATTFACLTTCFYAAGHVGEFTVMWLNGFETYNSSQSQTGKR